VEVNPKVRLVLLSATMPNVDEICGWVSKLTGRDTYYLESDYRPCPLTMHYEVYYDGDDNYDEKEAAKVGAAAGIVEYYAEDKFLVFVHSKRTGQMMLRTLNRCGIEAEFHNADLDLESRLKLEDKFKEDKNFKVVVATPTLAWGVNLPARRVVIVGVHRGLERVENYNIQQMVGRAGRLGLDDSGDAYILVPESTKKETIQELRKKEPIRSTLLVKQAGQHNKILAFHVVSEIFYGNITTKEGFYRWFERTLAHYQDQGFDEKEADNTIKLLEQFKAIRTNDEGQYECTAIGKIASLFYYSPFDVHDLRRNFHFLFEGKREGNDHAVAMALGNIDSFRWGVTNKTERKEMAAFTLSIERMFGKGIFTESAIKTGYAYFNMLMGRHNVPSFHAVQAGLYADLDRTMEVLHAINSMGAVWDKKGYFNGLQIRLKYGVTSDLVELCTIPNVGQARAKRLKAVGINGVDDMISADAANLAKVMKCNVKLAEEALDGARKMVARRLLDG
jgi:helicase